MMNVHDKEKGIREYVRQWGYDGVMVIVSFSDNVILINNKILKDHPELPEIFSLKKKNGNLYNNMRLQKEGSDMSEFYL